MFYSSFKKQKNPLCAQLTKRIFDSKEISSLLKNELNPLQQALTDILE